MGRLITVSFILILGATGGAVKGEIPDDAAASPPSATRQPPVPPIKYLEAGARLFNSAVDSTQLELAAKYLQAAESFRGQLQPDEQATLDAYLKELVKAKAVLANGGTAPASPAAASAAAARPQPTPPGTSQPAAPAAAPGATAGTRQSPPSFDTRQRARWLLHEAREQLLVGNYDAAQQKVADAEALDIKWGLFDDTPAKVGEEIKRARPHTTATPVQTAAAQSHDRHAARAKLKEARAALNNRQFEQAEVIALEVKNWGLNYGFFEDNPDKVAAAARAPAPP